MGIFGWKKSEEKKADAAPAAAEAGAPSTAGADGAGGGFSPEKAERFFSHARTVHETTNYEYAMQLWLSGLRLDPTSMPGMQGFFKSAAAFLDKAGEKARPSKDVIKPISSGSPVDRYLTALLEWGMKPLDPAPAVRCVELGAGIGLKEPVEWIGVRAFNCVVKDKKPRKDLLLKLKEAANKSGAYTLAVQSAEAALRLDPTDGPLAAEIRNLSAQETMNKGGFDRAGEVGGFRANIKDAEKQRMLEAQDSIVKSAGTLDALIKSAEEDHTARPTDIPAAQVFIKRLMERARPDDEARALKLMDEMYSMTKQFIFREQAGDLRMRIARRKIVILKETAESRPTDAAAQAAYDKAQRDLLEYELEEFRLRVEAYPTDLGRKYRLAEKYFNLGLLEESIALFQESQNDPKLRGDSLKFLGRSFLKIGWINEAIETFRKALDGRDLLPDLALELRYDLMRALKGKGQHDRDLGAAEEADKIASSIAIQQITYRDIRAQRDELKKLILELRSGGAPAPAASQDGA
ncbi:MAG: hypothetical protein KF787_04635 [Phycisphaeraceae bacterium]|nr:hypothetical protein [Phycisphaerae bacterium]MBX3391915.1 hypothetical protein [Phycisphaeraceae bacterium]